MKLKKLQLTMKNGMTYVLPLDEPRNSQIHFKCDRITFEEYWEEGYKPFDLPEIYYLDEIKDMRWL